MIVCKGKDGSLSSTPFIVKLSHVMPNSEITLTVNGVKTLLKMKLNPKQEAYFEIPVDSHQKDQKANLSTFFDVDKEFPSN